MSTTFSTNLDSVPGTIVGTGVDVPIRFQDLGDPRPRDVVKCAEVCYSLYTAIEQCKTQSLCSNNRTREISKRLIGKSR